MMRKWFMDMRCFTFQVMIINVGKSGLKAQDINEFGFGLKVLSCHFRFEILIHSKTFRLISVRTVDKGSIGIIVVFEASWGEMISVER